MQELLRCRYGCHLSNPFRYNTRNCTDSVHVAENQVSIKAGSQFQGLFKIDGIAFL